MVNGQPRTFKVCTLGESGAGKSSLIMRLTTGNFHPNQVTTIGAAFLAWSSPDGSTRMEIWDTAGQERYATLAPMYYRNAAAILVVYDMTDRSSFERAERWLVELPSTMPADAVLVLVANKADLQEERQVTEKDGKQLAETHKCNHYFETSAKDNVGIQECFEYIADEVARTSAAAPQPQQTVIMNGPPPAAQKGGCCTAQDATRRGYPGLESFGFCFARMINMRSRRLAAIACR
eukprot:TRINITY_DN30921_c0_g1_i8.p1 TRINITY_DN30921_c0_g1~~TRINITY_DN30921_c0_g1_i8.p1  ORF type:complete len:275 (+),score=16.91 TRINITY_DN30921_c0_g1_i8:122-826(+)